MAGGSGFYKGEKKKAKKTKEAKNVGLGAPVFVLPELISKKKKNSWE